MANVWFILPAFIRSDSSKEFKKQLIWISPNTTRIRKVKGVTESFIFIMHGWCSSNFQRWTRSVNSHYDFLGFQTLGMLQLAPVTLPFDTQTAPFPVWLGGQLLQFWCSDRTPLAVGGSITFRHRRSQASLLHFLSQSWNQSFAQGVLALFHGKC